MAETFGKWLEEQRESRGLSQNALAAKSDVSRPTISKIEDGLVGASVEMVEKLADGLGMDRVEALSAWVALAVLKTFRPITVDGGNGERISAMVPADYDPSKAEAIRLSIETALEVQRRRDRRERGPDDAP